jgi:hypothetical protein
MTALGGPEFTLAWSFDSSLRPTEPFFQKICAGFVDNVFDANDSEGYNGHSRGESSDRVHFAYKVGCRVMVQMVGDAFHGQYVLVKPVSARERYVEPFTRRQVELRVGIVPIMYGWACTVHYVQGKTLRCNVVVHLPSMWEVGMGYVGFSRPVSFENMRVLSLQTNATATNLNGSLFKVSGLVEEFYAGLAAEGLGDVEIISISSDDADEVPLEDAEVDLGASELWHQYGGVPDRVLDRLPVMGHGAEIRGTLKAFQEQEALCAISQAVEGAIEAGVGVDTAQRVVSEVGLPRMREGAAVRCASSVSHILRKVRCSSEVCK